MSGAQPLRIYYDPAYASRDTPRLERLGVCAAMVERLRLGELQPPPRFDPAMLDGLHTPEYLHAFLQGAEPLASSQGIPWTPGIRDATLAMLGGQLAGARHALERGIAMNLARGFHHAVPGRGSGYCPLNGLALVAHAMPEAKVFVIDCDEHGGNGTEEFAALLPNLYATSVFGTRFGCRGGTRSWAYPANVRSRGFAHYLLALAEIRALLEAHRPDLILYQAGADCHHKDPKSLLRLSTSQMYNRDLVVFRMARELRIPVLFLVAGGYQAAEKVARLNINTVRAAHHVYRDVLARH